MALTTMNSGAALVGRLDNLGDHMKTMTVKVLRPFYYQREVQKLGAVVELPAVFATEMIAATKAERHEETAPPAAPPVKEKSKGKDGDHAGK